MGSVPCVLQTRILPQTMFWPNGLKVTPRRSWLWWSHKSDSLWSQVTDSCYMCYEPCNLFPDSAQLCLNRSRSAQHDASPKLVLIAWLAHLLLFNQRPTNRPAQLPIYRPSDLFLSICSAALGAAAPLIATDTSPWNKTRIRGISADEQTWIVCFVRFRFPQSKTD